LGQNQTEELAVLAINTGAVMSHLWEKSYPAGLSWGDPLPEAAPLETLLSNAASRWPQQPAIDFYDRKLAFGELHDLARRTAAGLQKLGIGRGRRVGLYLPNTPHYVVSFFGVLMAGATVVNFGPLSGPRELRFQVQDAAVGTLFTIDMPMFYSAASALLADGKVDNLIVCSVGDFLGETERASLKIPRIRVADAQPGQQRFADLISHGDEFDAPHRGPLQDELAVLQYTGGTTGMPKGAMLTHGNFLASLSLSGRVAFALMAERAKMPGAMPGNNTPRRLVVMPLSYIGGLGFGMLHQMLSGTENVLHLSFDAGRALETIEKKRITEFAAVPTMYTALANHPRFPESDLSSLRLWGFGGAPIARGVVDTIYGRVGKPTQQLYGLTETTGSCTFQYAATGSAGTNTVGLPMPLTQIEIMDLATGLTPVAQGEPGEICVRGPLVMQGYWNDVAATEWAFRGGRFHTGDIGVMDENGYISLLDRQKDMILVGGFNVYPRRIEDAVREHPSVADAAVVGIEHGHFGQIPKAFVVQRAGTPSLTLPQLLDFLADKLSRYEMPLELEILESLPKTAIGKVAKRELVAPAAPREARA
jgi:long-chain acyl-CoA synthetase